VLYWTVVPVRFRSIISGLASGFRHSSQASTIGAALLALILLAGTLPLLAALAQPGTSTSEEINEDFIHGTIVRPDRLLTVEGFQAGDQGWYLNAGASGRLVYRVPGYPATRIGVNLWLYLRAGVTNTISVSAPGLPTVQVASNLASLGDRLAIPPLYASASSVDVQIEGRNSSPTQQLILVKIATYAISGTDPRAPPAYTFIAFGALVALIAFIIVRRRPHARLAAIGVGVVASIAAASRLSALFVLSLPVDPDAVGYRTYADRFQWWPLFDKGLFSGNFSEREPLYPMVAHIYFQVLGSSDFHLRVVSSTLSVAVVILTVVAARRRLQTWWAPVLVGLVIAISGPLIFESYRGLRLELETLLVLGLYLALDRKPARRPFLDATLIGLLGAAMALARTYLIAVFLAAVAVSFLVRYKSLPRVVALVIVATLIMGGAEAAHRVGMAEHRGNAFWDTAGYVRWNANEELYRFHRPLSHIELFPTLTQYQTLGPYSGPPITSYQYLFVIHSPLELARDSLAGARGIFDSMDPFIFDVKAGIDIHKFPSSLSPIAKSLASRFDLLLQWTVLLGLMAMCLRSVRDPRLIIIPTIVVSWVATTSFLSDHGLVEKYRHTWQVYPLAVIAGGLLVESAVVFASRHVRWRQVVNVDAALLATSLLLTLAQPAMPQSLRLLDAALVAVGVGVLAYRRPALGLGAALLAVSTGAASTGAVAAVAAAAAILLRLLPSIRSLAPLLALVPLAAAIVLGGGKWSLTSFEMAATLLGVTVAVAVAARQNEGRYELVWLLAAIGPLAGISYLIHPSAPGAVELAPFGVVAAGWLYVNGHRWALALGLIDLALVILVLPLAAWVAVAVALVWIAIQSGRIRPSRRFVVAGSTVAVLLALTAGASLAATTPSPAAAWTTKLSSTDASITQRITVDRAGDNAIWIYARRSSVFTDYPSSVVVNGDVVTSDLNSLLLTDVLVWTRVPLSEQLHVGDRMDVEIHTGGSPNPVDRFIEVGGVYATADGITSPGVNGTYLVVLGDSSMPLAPGGLPEPMVRNRLQPPMGEWMPGELTAPGESRKEAGVLQIWQQTLGIAAGHPLGIGTGNLSRTLVGTGAGLGPGLTARSEPLQAFAEWGILGLGGLLLVMGVAAWFARRSRDPLAAALLVVAAITLVGESILVEPAGAAGVWIALGFCLGAIGLAGSAPSISRASNGEMPPETSQPAATHVG
jgi:hypothetical protein